MFVFSPRYSFTPILAALTMATSIPKTTVERMALIIVITSEKIRANFTRTKVEGISAVRVRIALHRPETRQQGEHHWLKEDRRTQSGGG